MPANSILWAIDLAPSLRDQFDELRLNPDRVQAELPLYGRVFIDSSLMWP
jgi:hypothetical protein